MAFSEYWVNSADAMLPGERVVTAADLVALYEEKHLVHGRGLLKLTNQRLLWIGPQVFSMNLDKILSTSFDAGTWTKSEKIIVAVSSELTFRLSFRGGGCKDFLQRLEAALCAKEWLYGVARKGHGIGIGGIQKKIQTRAEQTDLYISAAFEDLSNLMASAKDMVELSQKLMVKSKDKGLTDDETVQFRSQLLSIGLTEFGSQVGYSGDNQLQQEIICVLLPVCESSSGMISLTEAYCRINRARGLRLLSPEDMLAALERIKHPIKLTTFTSGLRVVQLSSLDESAWKDKIVSLIEEAGSLSAEELATCLKTSAVLALERLLQVEGCNRACRDESVNGLVFYPNRFLEGKTA
ncbi:vacuolar protein-sorting-associated protein 36-like [Varroa jacobsoni]|uniref:Vacuolar protein-sorting-associated protein 36 n=1 Tax=Varroa destructor TaxID=109461 RepID=A0A7M7KNX4_VARDE|nr:vacuolar protein-sorting-associated protein 36-like [Varroa destructor]XP_022710247.1 vacuolar protein-sorting-associated protein 36-like [Varroa jacobsoni]